ncbi:MAG: HAMP domain-containing protein [Polyangiaceae bacterium]|nr:HAMP domain-containing protein [Polyangiaceae bacterium]
MAQAGAAPAAATGRHQRQLKNYLLDKHFQLKYTGYLVAIALILSLALGLVLWRTSRAVIAQSHEAVNQGEQVVALGREVVGESQKVSAVVQMNIVKDPVYSDNPGLLDAFKTDAAKQDERLKKQQQALEEQAAALKVQSQSLAQRQQTMLLTLCLVLTLLVLGVGFAGIMVTHKVAGPIFKMKRQIRELGDGSLRVPGRLRKGDELVEFFEAFEKTVQQLRDREEGQVKLVEETIAALESAGNEADVQRLRKVRDTMKLALDS